MSDKVKSDLYKSAGVDIDLAQNLLERVKAKLTSTKRPEMLCPIGGFGGLFQLDLSKYDKPVLVSEFQFGSRDRGPFWPGPLEVAREEDRGPAYGNFLKAALAQPNIVGAHWFQYLDQPASGRLLDGENGHLGLVAITDMPYPGFVDAVRKSNLQAVSQLRTQLEKPAP